MNKKTVQNRKNELKNSFKTFIKNIKKENSHRNILNYKETNNIIKEDYFTMLKGNFKDFYKNTSILGQGTTAVVKKTLCLKTNKYYAVKIIRSRDEEIIYQIKEEFKNLKTLNHINIIKVNRLFIDKLKGKIYLIMEYIESEELFNYIITTGNYNELLAKKIFKQLLEGINYLHSQGIIHRDLKPNNILITVDNVLKIADFNIAKFSNNYNNYDIEKKDNYKMLTYTGTIAFNAPEKFSKTYYTEVIDCWSAGCILYTMLIGKQPFYKETISSLIEQIKNCDYDKSCNEWIDLSIYAKELINLLINADPNKRLTPKEALNHYWFTCNKNSNLNHCIYGINNNRKSLIRNLNKNHSFHVNEDYKNNKLIYSESLNFLK